MVTGHRHEHVLRPGAALARAACRRREHAKRRVSVQDQDGPLRRRPRRSPPTRAVAPAHGSKLETRADPAGWIDGELVYAEVLARGLPPRPESGIDGQQPTKKQKELAIQKTTDLKRNKYFGISIMLALFWIIHENIERAH